MTVLEVLQSTTAYFKKRDIESARLNAEHLVAHSLGKKRLELYLEFDRPLAEPELGPLRDLVRRRGQGEPLQHLLGTVEFCGLLFRCDGRALIPRPETEQLVELLKSKIENAKSKIADIGTGSGVIALSLASKLPEAEIVATDLSPGALALARENAEALGLAARVEFRETDLLEGAGNDFDLIVANLPYIASGEIPTLASEVRRDPLRALDGGSAGSELIARLIDTAPAHLRVGGRLALEIGRDQADVLTAALAAKNFRDIAVEKDYGGNPRFLFAIYG